MPVTKGAEGPDVDALAHISRQSFWQTHDWNTNQYYAL